MCRAGGLGKACSLLIAKRTREGVLTRPGPLFANTATGSRASTATLALDVALRSSLVDHCQDLCDGGEVLLRDAATDIHQSI